MDIVPGIRRNQRQKKSSTMLQGMSKADGLRKIVCICLHFVPLVWTGLSSRLDTGVSAVEKSSAKGEDAIDQIHEKQIGSSEVIHWIELVALAVCSDQFLLKGLFE